MNVLDPDAIEAPDLADAIEAWRVWRVVATDDGYRLGSVVQPTVWPPDEPLVAECLRSSPVVAWFRKKRSRTHAIPEPQCACGIYAAWLPSLSQYLIDPLPNGAVGRVLGQVSLWGTVIECDRGFRASHAYPLRIYVPVKSSPHGARGWDELVEGLEAYGVPVEVLEARSSEAVRVLEQQELASLHETDR